MTDPTSRDLDHAYSVYAWITDDRLWGDTPPVWTWPSEFPHAHYEVPDEFLTDDENAGLRRAKVELIKQILFAYGDVMGLDIAAFEECWTTEDYFRGARRVACLN